MSQRTLFLMRHAQAEEFAPGRTDDQRRLTPHGLSQAQAAGDYLRGIDVTVDQVLCSTAVRAQETAEQLGLGAPITAAGSIYNAAAETISNTIATHLDDDVATALVVGHAPGIPALVHALADVDRCASEKVQLVARRFPTGTLVRLDLSGNWDDLQPGIMRDVWLAD